MRTAGFTPSRLGTTRAGFLSSGSAHAGQGTLCGEAVQCTAGRSHHTPVAAPSCDDQKRLQNGPWLKITISEGCWQE